jgi:hypothetical protein
MEQIEASGMDAVICANFTPSSLPEPEDFVKDVLVDTLG